MSDTEIIFSYQRPDKKKEETLIVNTGANSVYWAYNLNTQTFPTYGGEVVQILSCSINDVEIEGECRNYLQMEDIYHYFATYMQFASQGLSSKSSVKYIGNPIRMRIPSRGWNLKIIPKTVPGFRLATEVVAPAWKVTAQVFEDDDIASGQILSAIASKYYGTPDITIQQAINQTSTLSEIGYYPDSGFVNPNRSLGGNKSGPNKFDGKALKKSYEDRGEAFNNLVKTYIENDGKNAYGSLFDGINYSSPYEKKAGDGKKNTR